MAELVGGLSAGSRTAAYDAAVTAARWVAGGEGERAVVLLTDGKDNASQATPDDVRSALRASGAMFVGVGYQGGDGLDDDELRGFAAASGGRYLTASQASQLPAVFAWIRQRIAATYAVEGALPDTTPGRHVIDVLAKAGGREYRASAEVWLAGPGAGPAFSPVRVGDAGLSGAAAPANGGWWLLRKHECTICRKLYSTPYVGGVLEWLGSTLIGVGENGTYSWGGVALSLLLLLATAAAAAASAPAAAGGAGGAAVGTAGWALGRKVGGRLVARLAGNRLAKGFVQLGRRANTVLRLLEEVDDVLNLRWSRGLEAAKIKLPSAGRRVLDALQEYYGKHPFGTPPGSDMVSQVEQGATVSAKMVVSAAAEAEKEAPALARISPVGKAIRGADTVKGLAEYFRNRWNRLAGTEKGQ